MSFLLWIGKVNQLLLYSVIQNRYPKTATPNSKVDFKPNVCLQNHPNWWILNSYLLFNFSSLKSATGTLQCGMMKKNLPWNFLIICKLYNFIRMSYSFLATCYCWIKCYCNLALYSCGSYHIVHSYYDEWITSNVLKNGGLTDKSNHFLNYSANTTKIWVATNAYKVPD